MAPSSRSALGMGQAPDEENAARVLVSDQEYKGMISAKDGWWSGDGSRSTTNDDGGGGCSFGSFLVDFNEGFVNSG